MHEYYLLFTMKVVTLIEDLVDDYPEMFHQLIVTQ